MITSTNCIKMAVSKGCGGKKKTKKTVDSDSEGYRDRQHLDKPKKPNARKPKSRK